MTEAPLERKLFLITDPAFPDVHIRTMSPTGKDRMAMKINPFRGLKPGVFPGLILSGAFYPNLKIGVLRRKRMNVLLAKINPLPPVILAAACLALVPSCGKPAPSTQEPVIFTTFVEFPNELPRLKVMVESLRTFGGLYKDAPVWAYVADDLLESPSESLEAASSFGAEIRTISVPADVAWFYLVRKVFAGAHAEKEAAGKAGILARLDPDTIFIAEPAELILPEGITLGWRPVFHRNISPLFDEPMDDYWSRAYEAMGIDESDVFPMVTPADEDQIRPYFQAGCVVVRPERGILAKWEETLVVLSRDPVMREICERDPGKRTFTFQVALTGAVLNHLERSEMLAFTDRINYPIFFKEMFGAKKDFHDINGAVTLRYEHFLQNTPPDWDKILKGPADRIAWIKERFGRSIDPDGRP